MNQRANRPGRPWNMSAAAAAILAVTSAAFAANDGAPEPTQSAQDKLFARLDTDQDGLLTRSEAARERGLDRVFEQADENRDGKLAPGEFVKARSINERMLLADFGRDSLITAKVKAALIREPKVGSLGIGVKTQDGVVLLSGKVTDPSEAERVRTLARSVDGVVDVRDQLMVSR